MWALGVLLYELCTLERPFQHANRYKLNELIIAGKYTPLPAGRYPDEISKIIQSLPFIQRYVAKFGLLMYFPPPALPSSSSSYSSSSSSSPAPATAAVSLSLQFSTATAASNRKATDKDSAERTTNNESRKTADNGSRKTADKYDAERTTAAEAKAAEAKSNLAAVSSTKPVRNAHGALSTTAAAAVATTVATVPTLVLTHSSLPGLIVIITAIIGV